MSRSFSALVAIGIFIAGCTGNRPMNLGVHDGKLAPCPASPNCVSSQSADNEHAVEPLRYTGSPGEAMERLKTTVIGMKRSRIIRSTGPYIHAEFTSALFRFVDDVEFLVDDRASLIHVRSASRIGHSDLGVNRRRIETIRTMWTAGPGQSPPAN